VIAGAKPTPISSGRNPKTVSKGPAKRIGALESDRGSDCIDREVGRDQAAPGLIQPMILNESSWRLSEGVFEAAHELPG
jgi:hypothetical protein